MTNIAVFGATAKIGCQIVREAESHGHEVTAVVREAESRGHGVTAVVRDPARLDL